MTDPRTKLLCDEAVLRNHDFSEAVLEGIIFMDACVDGSSFRGADLYWAIATGTSFRDCDFTDAVLRGANLKETDFTGACLRRTDFSRDNVNGATSLQGADLSGAAIRDCRFEGARFDSRTRFPKGFYPEKHGLHFHEAT